jgi:lysozyme family protein
MGQEINRLMNDLPEMTFRIKRLAALAKTKGKIAIDIADEIFESIATGTKIKVMPIGQIRDQIGKFNIATREAHGEILSAQNSE